MKTVPNLQPRITGQPYRIAILGEAPGSDEEEQGIPFCGHSGRLLSSMLAGAGILRDACFVGNVCQVRPPGNKIELFKWSSDEIQHGITELEKDLLVFKPNLCLLLGATPLRWAKGTKESIENWRGSLFSTGTLHTPVDWKCLPSIHPAAALRDYSYTPLLRFDLRRAATEGRFPDLRLPTRQLITHLTTDQLLWELQKILDEKPTIAIDIEGGIDTMSCLSIARTPLDSFIVPLSKDTTSSLWLALTSVLSNPSVPKILQNSLYDLFVLQYSYNIPVRGVIDDTMLKHWELYCELPKSLGFQCSIYTKQPFYKEDRHSEDRTTFYEYCCTDSCVTYEINDVLTRQLTGLSLSHYKLNLALLEPLLYMELKGILYAKTLAQEKLAKVTKDANRLQWALNEISGRGTRRETFFDTCKETFGYQRQLSNIRTWDDLLSNTKTTSLHLASRAVTLPRDTEWNIATKGEASILTETHLNIDSKTQLPQYLYRELNLPPQYKKLHGRLTEKETTDQLALLTLYKKTEDEVLKLILNIRALRTRAETLSARTDGDGRIRCGYNIVGTETGRLSCYQSPTGSGFNLQTVTKKDRDLFLPDHGYWFFQCDLSGADGWTVAAWCKACGDPTMLDDYLFGLKPALILSLIAIYGRVVLSWSREKLKEESKTIDQNDWMYFARKQVQHGSCYGMKGSTMSEHILRQSYKKTGEPVFVPPDVCTKEQAMFFTRYPGVLMWHERVKRQLKQHGFLVSASGHKRTFFGRRDDYDTFKKACADEPQNNTTYAIKLALHRMWTDPENRSQDDNSQDDPARVDGIPVPHGPGPSSGRSLLLSQSPTQETKTSFSTLGTRCTLRIQPLHTVHDSINGQFRKEETTWSTDKIRSYFNNPILIAGQSIVIPFEGAYGESWGKLKEGQI